MIFFSDIPQANVAEELGISQMQVSRRLKKAIAALQELMSGNGVNQNYKSKNKSNRRVSRSSLGAKLKAQKNI